MRYKGSVVVDLHEGEMQLYIYIMVRKMQLNLFSK